MNFFFAIIYRRIGHAHEMIYDELPKVNSGISMVVTVQVLPPSEVDISPVTPSPLPTVLM